MIIEGSSVAECWLKCLQKIVEKSGTEISPVIVRIDTSEGRLPSYHSDLVSEINEFIGADGSSVQTTANTIFPESLSHGAGNIYERFEKIWKRVKKDPKNRYGHYFRRLTAYGEKSPNKEKCPNEPVNQLKHIIEAYNGTQGREPLHRRSALIATTFDPTLDHSTQRQRGFPCLQQVCFVPYNQTKMRVNAIYAMQYLSDRAFGNYLGLVNLGRFMAREMRLTLTEVQCIVSVLELGRKMNKTEAKEIVDRYKSHI